MKTAVLLDVHRRLLTDAAALFERKSHDYASATDDALATMKACGVFGVPPTTGALLRLLDKLGRLNSLVAKDPQVANESIRDTVLDIINYAVLWYALHTEATTALAPAPTASAGSASAGAETVSDTAYLEAYHDWCVGRFGAAPTLKPGTRERVLTQLHTAVKAAQRAQTPAASLAAFQQALEATRQHWGDAAEIAALYQLLAFRKLVPDAPCQAQQAPVRAQ